MCSRPFETRSLPSLLAATHRGFTLITRTAPVLAPATLAALPSTRAIPDRDVFYVAFPKSSIRALGFAHLCRSRPRGSVHSLLPSQFYLLCRSSHRAPLC